MSKFPIAENSAAASSSLATASRILGKKAALASGLHATMTKSEAAIARKKLELQQAIDKSLLEAQLASGGAHAATATADERLPARGAVVEPPLTRAEGLHLLKLVEEIHRGQDKLTRRLEAMDRMLTDQFGEDVTTDYADNEEDMSDEEEEEERKAPEVVDLTNSDEESETPRVSNKKRARVPTAPVKVRNSESC